VSAGFSADLGDWWRNAVVVGSTQQWWRTSTVLVCCGCLLQKALAKSMRHCCDEEGGLWDLSQLNAFKIICSEQPSYRPCEAGYSGVQ
jgi:hypothetical protein